MKIQKKKKLILKNNYKNSYCIFLIVVTLIFNSDIISQVDSSLKINKLSKFRIGSYLNIKDDTTIKNGTKRNFILENKVDSIQNGTKISYFFNTYSNGNRMFNYRLKKNLKNIDYFDTIISPLTLKSFEDTIPNISITYQFRTDSLKTYSILINVPVGTIIINSKKLFICKSYELLSGDYKKVLEIVNREYKFRRNNYIWDHSFITYYDSSFQIPIITYHLINPSNIYITKFYQFENNVKYELSENEFIFYLQNLNCILGW